MLEKPYDEQKIELALESAMKSSSTANDRGRQAAPQASASEKDRQSGHNSPQSFFRRVLLLVIKPSEGPSNGSAWFVRRECRLSLNQ